MRKFGDDDVGPPVIVVVLKINAHAGKGVAIAIESGSGRQSNLLERSVAAVVKEVFRHRIIGEQDIHEAVAIIVRDREAQTFSRLVDSSLMRYLGELPTAVIVKQKYRFRLEQIGMAIRTGAIFSRLGAEHSGR